MAMPSERRQPGQELAYLLKVQQGFAEGREPSPGNFTNRDMSGLGLSGADLRLATLCRVNLRGADLAGANLKGAFVLGADFRDTSVTIEQAKSARGWVLAKWEPALHKELGNYEAGLDLSGEDLSGIDMVGKSLRNSALNHVTFGDADLHGTDLQETSLHNVDLSKVRGLAAWQLRGADLTGATLPKGIDESLKKPPGVDEATKTSGKVFLTMLAACLYCWLTVLSATDTGLLLGNSSLALPIVQTAIPVVAFFFAAPILLLIIYVYLHFALQSLWDGLATLPSVFPDGRPLHERVTPWILSPLPRLYFSRLKDGVPMMPRFRVVATVMLMWWAVPVTLVGFWIRFLVVRNPWITAIHVLMIGFSVWLAATLWRAAKDTLRGIPADTRPGFRSLVRPPLFVGVAVFGLAGVFSFGCHFGEPAGSTARTLAPALLRHIGVNVFGNLAGADLSAKPKDWDGKNLDEVMGVNLSRRKLRGVSADHVFAVKADLSYTDLERAVLRFGDLRDAGLYYADLFGADLQAADLRGANLNGANLLGTDLREADLQGASFGQSEPSHKNPRLPEIIKAGYNWALAKVDRDTAIALKLCQAPCDREWKDFSGMDLRGFGRFRRPDFSNANLEGATLPYQLSHADLSHADLRDAKVPNSDLTDANLLGADLRGSDLTGAHGLTPMQIQSTNLIDAKTKLPTYLAGRKLIPLVPPRN